MAPKAKTTTKVIRLTSDEIEALNKPWVEASSIDATCTIALVWGHVCRTKAILEARGCTHRELEEAFRHAPLPDIPGPLGARCKTYRRADCIGRMANKAHPAGLKNGWKADGTLTCWTPEQLSTLLGTIDGNDKTARKVSDKPFYIRLLGLAKTHKARAHRKGLSPKERQTAIDMSQYNAAVDAVRCRLWGDEAVAAAGLPVVATESPDVLSTNKDNEAEIASPSLASTIATLLAT